MKVEGQRGISMGSADDGADGPEHLHETPHLADALESDRFKQFLDHVPFGVIVAELRPGERIRYANLEFKRLSGKSAREIEGKTWSDLPVEANEIESGRQLRDAITQSEDYLGVFALDGGGEASTIHVWSNVIEDDDGTPMFR